MSRFSAIVLALLVLLPLAGAVAAEGPATGTLQGLVGAAGYASESLTFEFAGAQGDEGEDLATMPCLGLAGQYALAGRIHQVGAEFGALFGWRSRESSVVVGTERTVVDIDSSLWMLDLSAGLYGSLVLGSRWRLYLGAGPAMVFAEYEQDDDREEAEGEASGDRSESEFGVGAYARAGIEYQYLPGSLVGVSVRGLATNLEFDHAGGERVEGIQGFVSFTRLFQGY